MTLEDGKQLLSREELPYTQLHYENERSYYNAVCPWSSNGQGQRSPVTVLRVEAPNGKRHLDLQFVGDHLSDLFFGGFSFELWEAEDLEAELLDYIRQITSGRSWVGITMNGKNRRWMGDGWFPTGDGNDTIRDALEKLRRPKMLRERLFRTHRLYEIYDWNEYHQIER